MDEWRALPWWQTRLYTEGLNHEFAPADGGLEVTEDGQLAQVVPLEALGVSWS